MSLFVMSLFQKFFLLRRYYVVIIIILIMIIIIMVMIMMIQGQGQGPGAKARTQKRRGLFPTVSQNFLFSMILGVQKIKNVLL